MYRIVGGPKLAPPQPCNGACTPVRFKSTGNAPWGYFGLECDCAATRVTHTIRGGPFDGLQVGWVDEKVGVWVPLRHLEVGLYALHQFNGDVYEYIYSRRQDQMEVTP